MDLLLTNYFRRLSRLRFSHQSRRAKHPVTMDDTRHWDLMILEDKSIDIRALIHQDIGPLTLVHFLSFILIF